jgi:hypothetical protein
MSLKPDRHSAQQQLKKGGRGWLHLGRWCVQFWLLRVESMMVLCFFPIFLWWIRDSYILWNANRWLLLLLVVLALPTLMIVFVTWFGNNLRGVLNEQIQR